MSARTFTAARALAFERELEARGRARDDLRAARQIERGSGRPRARSCRPARRSDRRGSRARATGEALRSAARVPRTRMFTASLLRSMTTRSSGTSSEQHGDVEAALDRRGAVRRRPRAGAPRAAATHLVAEVRRTCSARLRRSRARRAAARPLAPRRRRRARRSRPAASASRSTTRSRGASRPRDHLAAHHHRDRAGLLGDHDHDGVASPR